MLQEVVPMNSSLPPEQRVKITCDLSDTVFAIFLSSVKQWHPNFSLKERQRYFKQLVVERERTRRL